METIMDEEFVLDCSTSNLFPVIKSNPLLLGESKTIWIDLDDTNANFSGHFEELHGVSLVGMDDETFWKTFNRENGKYAKGFFRDLKPFPGYLVFLQFVVRMGFSYGYDERFLSALSPHNAMPLEEQAKEKDEWIEEYVTKFGFNIPATYVTQASEKKHYALPGDILIDDSARNCSEWREAGGTAIHHRNFEQSMTELLIVLELLDKK
jgi:hypothetical protein